MVQNIATLVMIGGWLMVVVASIFFRKPDAPFFDLVWPWQVPGRLSPDGRAICGLGILILAIGWLAGYLAQRKC